MKIKIKCPNCKCEFYVEMDNGEQNVAGYSVLEFKCPNCGTKIILNADEIYDKIVEEDDMYDQYWEESFFE